MLVPLVSVFVVRGKTTISGRWCSLGPCESRPHFCENTTHNCLSIMDDAIRANSKSECVHTLGKSLGTKTCLGQWLPVGHVELDSFVGRELGFTLSLCPFPSHRNIPEIPLRRPRVRGGTISYGTKLRDATDEIFINVTRVEPRVPAGRSECQQHVEKIVVFWTDLPTTTSTSHCPGCKLLVRKQIERTCTERSPCLPMRQQTR